MPNLGSETESKMKVVIEVLANELKKVHIGRANTGLVENILVSAYGQPTPIKALANISVPEPNQIAITPWDKDQLGAIETAIRESELSLSLVNDGNAVRVTLPPMTEERRQELVRQINKMVEEARIELRNLRHEALEKLKKEVEAGEATEDDKYKITQELDELIKKYNDEADKIARDKEAEVMKV